MWNVGKRKFERDVKTILMLFDGVVKRLMCGDRIERVKLKYLKLGLDKHTPSRIVMEKVKEMNYGWIRQNGKEISG